MKVFLALLCALAAASAQTPSQPQPTPFSFQLYNVASPDSSKSRLLVCLAVLHDDLSFAKADSGFDARYEMALDITSEEGDWAGGREEKRRIHVRDYDETNSRRKYSTHDFEFDLLPGKYLASFSFTDRVSGAVSRLNTTKEVRSFSADKARLALSDIILLDHIVTDSLNRTVITPGLYNNTTTPERELYLYVETFRANASEPLFVRQTIRNWQRQTVLEQKREWPCRARLEHLVLPIWIDVLPYGVYEIEMKVQQGKAEKTVRERFHLTWNGIPANGVHLDQALAAALFLADPKEREPLQTALRDFSIEQKRDVLLEFWERRDDTPATPENGAMNTYYQRVEFANEKFSGREEGWKTDFGRIFLTFGVPDAIESVEADARAAQIQVWHYRRLARQFFFVDVHGNGDYRLMAR